MSSQTYPSLELQRVHCRKLNDLATRVVTFYPNDFTRMVDSDLSYWVRAKRSIGGWGSVVVG